MTTVAVLGSGRMGTLHAEALRNLDAELNLLIVDQDDRAAGALAERVSGSSLTDVSKAFSSADATVIATPTPTHCGLIKEALAYQLPIFCEKPVALTLLDIDDLLAVADRYAVPVQVGFQRRLDPQYQRLRQAVAAGEHGRLLIIRTTAFDHEPPAETFLAASGGIVADCLIHDLDVVRWLTGQGVSDVYAAGAVLTSEVYARHSDHELMTLVLGLDGGTGAVLSASRIDAAGYDHRLEILGTNGSVAVGWDDRTPITCLTRSGPETPSSPYTGFRDRFAAAYRAEMAAFLDLYRGVGDNPCPLREAREAIRAVEAARRSLQLGRPVRLAEIG